MKLLLADGEKTKADLNAGRYIKQAAYSLKETMKLANAFAFVYGPSRRMATGSWVAII